MPDLFWNPTLFFSSPAHWFTTTHNDLVYPNQREIYHDLNCTVNLYCLTYHAPQSLYIFCLDFQLTVLWGYFHLFQHAPKSSSFHSPLSLHQTTNKEEAEYSWRASQKKPSAGLSRSSNLHRAGSIKDLINKFSGPNHVSSSGSPQSPSSGTAKVEKSASIEALETPKSKSCPSTPSSVSQEISDVPDIKESRDTQTSQITARIDCPVGGSVEKTDSKPRSQTQITESGRDSVADSGMGSVSKEKKNSWLTISMGLHGMIRLHLLCMKTCRLGVALQVF